MIRPPFCPYRDCEVHYTAPTRARWWTRSGVYYTNLRGRIRRFRCGLCGRTFSEQTFHIDYYAKRGVDYRRLLGMQASCCGVRQTARQLKVDPKTVTNKIMRLSRQSIASHTRVMEDFSTAEDLCADGLQSFWVSQYVPNHITVLAGATSRFIMSAEGVSLRRRGRMTPRQKLRRRVLEKCYRPDPQAIKRSFHELCDLASTLVASSRRAHTFLDTDELPDYHWVVKRHGPLSILIAKGRLTHRRTSSKAPRTADNPLAAVNTIDRQIRTDLAEHVRETIRFARNPNRSMERFWVWMLQYNYRKRYRINQSVADTTTHAQAAGVNDSVLHDALAGIFTRRRFMSRSYLRGVGLRTWLRMIPRPDVPLTPEYLPDYLPAYLMA